MIVYPLTERERRAVRCIAACLCVCSVFGLVLAAAAAFGF